MPMTIAMTRKDGQGVVRRRSAGPVGDRARRAAPTGCTRTCAAFYRDPATPTGWNNTVFPNVGMPHVLWRLQGERVLKQEPAMQGRQARIDGHDGSR